MDINQQLEYLNLSADVLTEKDVLDTIKYDSTKIVSSKGIYEALQNLSASVSSDYSTKTKTSELFQNLSNQLSDYQKVGDYISGSMLEVLATKKFVTDQNYLKEHQSLSGYYKKNETSSAIELSNKFDAVDVDVGNRLLIDNFNAIISNYVLCSDISSKEELAAEFAKYVKRNEFNLSDYALKNTVSSKYELAREFQKYQKSGNYALSNEVSSKEELDEAFAKCSKLSINVSSDVELREEFAKYQKRGNYALCTDISSKEELDAAFAKCSKLSINVSSDAELSVEFAKYVKTDDAYKFALKSNVSTATQLSTKFSAIEKDINSRVKLSGDSTIYGNIDVLGSVKANEICASFENIKNLDPKTEISTVVDVIDENDISTNDYRSTIFAICEKINESIIYYRLPIDLIDSGFETSCEVSDITDVLNKISDITKTSKLSNNIDTDNFISAINADIDILNGVTYTYNVEQSLSTLNNIAQSNKTYIKYVADVVNDILFNLDKFCTKNYTSSVAEISGEFSQYYKKNDVYNKTDIQNKLDNYALSTSVYTKDQTNALLNNYALANDVASKYAKKNDICAYALSGDVKRELLKRALKDDVMTKTELCAKFDDIANEFENTVQLDRKSIISADVDAIYNLGANRLSAKKFNIDFSKEFNTNPSELISTLADTVDTNMSFGKLFSSLNSLILDSDLSIKLLNVKQSNPDNLEALLSTLNAVNDATKSQKLSNKSQLASYVASINNNVMLLSCTISSMNLQQSLSCLGKKIQIVNNKTRYNSDVIVDLANELERGYPKNQTSSAYELRKAFNKVQSLGDYVTTSTLCSYAKKTELPTKTSQLENDSKFALSADINIPNKTSQLINDSGFLSEHQSLTSYAKKTELPTKTSQLINDSGFLTTHQSLQFYAKKTELPTKTSQLINDSGFLSEHQSLTSYAKMNWVNDNYVPLTGGVIVNNLSVIDFTAGKINADFNYVIDDKEDKCLSGYLLFIQNPFVLEIVCKINEIITYCDLSIELIRSPENIYTKIFNATIEICRYAGSQLPQSGATYFDIQNCINVAITKIQINNGLSLQKIIQGQQHTSMLLIHYTNYLKKLIDQLSTDLNAANDDISYLSSRCDSLSAENIQLKNNVNGIRNSLSSFAIDDVGENGIVKNANAVLSTLIINFGGSIHHISL